ncbi:Hypothetical_protein [Hexamita inflata]|uniref:Hypothetical_protein n=1 Tax=Hexamita inflata TaxID=28002 RepID=A0AA86QBI4_9EUKA|nr:Hypothetical protein HINF_LOCUS20756 [Hexamita inflata]CAI9954953.1 Hypothetical protein HINF_LOCUS42598 [Hexamita inflata]
MQKLFKSMASRAPTNRKLDLPAQSTPIQRKMSTSQAEKCTTPNNHSVAEDLSYQEFSPTNKVNLDLSFSDSRRFSHLNESIRNSNVVGENNRMKDKLVEENELLMLQIQTQRMQLEQMSLKMFKVQEENLVLRKANFHLQADLAESNAKLRNKNRMNRVQIEKVQFDNDDRKQINGKELLCIEERIEQNEIILQKLYQRMDQ